MPTIFECPVCYLTDADGRRQNPCTPDAIHYTVLSCQKVFSQKKLSYGEIVYLFQVTVLVQGYITVYIDNVKSSSPIPFSETQTLLLNAPNCDNLIFTVKKFSCQVNPVFSSDKSTYQLEITIDIESIGRSTGEVEIVVPVIKSPECSDKRNLFAQTETENIWISVSVNYDRVSFTDIIDIFYKRTLLKAEVYQYNAVSDGIKKIFTNADEITEYGNKGILNPDSVSYLSLFINDVLQPQVNYDVTAGQLTLTTANVPIADAPIIIRFVTFRDNADNLLKGEIYQYNTVSDGVKREYTNADEITAYGNKGILNPNSVSFYNVYINGVLQPKTNYDIIEGLLFLKTQNIPLAGVPIIVEFITIKDSSGNILMTSLSQYNTVAENKKIYTNSDELTVYGHDGILNPELVSYQNLSINGVLQPSVNYTVSPGLLTLETADTPLAGVPIYLQSVSAYQQEY